MGVCPPTHWRDYVTPEWAPDRRDLLVKHRPEGRPPGASGLGCLAAITGPPPSFPLQYGDTGDDVATLASRSGAEIISDVTVDSLVDLDGFAAQVAAMDAVVTISNTGAHMAGALGIPTIILLDDKVHLVWPGRGSTYAWYPSVTLIRKQGRAWGDVIAEARGLLFDYDRR